MAWIKARIMLDDVSEPPSIMTPHRKLSWCRVRLSFSCWSKMPSRNEPRLPNFRRRCITCWTMRPYSLSINFPTFRERVIQLPKTRSGTHLRIGMMSTGGVAPNSITWAHCSMMSYISIICGVVGVGLRIPKTAASGS